MEEVTGERAAGGHPSRNALLEYRVSGPGNMTFIDAKRERNGATVRSELSRPVGVAHMSVYHVHRA